jgi:hypothetical protein
LATRSSTLNYSISLWYELHAGCSYVKEKIYFLGANKGIEFKDGHSLLPPGCFVDRAVFGVMFGGMQLISTK